MPPAKCASRRIDYRRCGNHRRGNAISAGFLIEGRRNIAETGGGYDWGRPAVVGRIIVYGPFATNHRGAHPNWGTNCSHRWTSSACAHIHADPRTRLRQGQNGDETQTRANHDFRFHGIAMILYIYAHDLASCNTDCCRTYGNLGDAVRLRLREVHGRLLHFVLNRGLSGQAARSCDPHPGQVSQQTLYHDRKTRF